MANSYYDIETLYQMKFKNSAFFLVAVSACCQKLLVIQIVRDYRKYQYSGNRGKKVVPYVS